MARGEQDKREEHKQRLSDLRDKLHKKVSYYEQKPYVSADEFYHLTKEFFLELLEKEYEPTYEEIIDELEELDHEFLSFSKKQREKVRDLLQRLSQAHYSNAQLSDEESQEVLAAFKHVVSDLTSNNERNIDQVLHRGLLALQENNKEQARGYYKRARTIYEDLSEQEQDQYYPQLSKLFEGVHD